MRTPKQKSSISIIKTFEYAHHPELAKKPLHTSDLYSLADAEPSEIREYGLFLIGEKVDVKDHE